MRRLRLATVLAATALLASVSSASAQGTFPNKFIKIVVGYSAGGGTDVVARVIGEKLSERLGQPVVVENKPGAGARLAVEFVARESHDLGGFRRNHRGGLQQRCHARLAPESVRARVRCRARSWLTQCRSGSPPEARLRATCVRGRDGGTLPWSGLKSGRT